MKTQKRKWGHRLSCALTAVGVALLLIVLPRAETMSSGASSSCGSATAAESGAVPSSGAESSPDGSSPASEAVSSAVQSSAAEPTSDGSSPASEAVSSAVRSSSGGQSQNSGVKARAEEGTKFSADWIRKSLSPIQPYAVFADYFDLATHMDGCIAVNTAKIGADFGNLHDVFQNYCRNSSTVTVEKKFLGTGAAAKTFRFGLSDHNTGLKIGDPQSMTLTAGEGVTGSATFFVDHNGVDHYDVNELTKAGDAIREGDLYDGYKLNKREKGKIRPDFSTVNCTSYIYSINISGVEPLTSYQLNSATPPDPPNKLVVGSGCQIDGSDVVCGKKRFHCLDPNNLTRVPQGQKFPIDFKPVLNDMAALSAKLAQAASSDTVTVEKFTPSQMNQDNCTIRSNGKLLLINIDASGYKTLGIPAQFKLNVDGEDSGGWAKAAENVVVNVYTKDEAGFHPYQHEITAIGYLMGTFLAPLATISDMECSYNGTIVANKVYSDRGEIHSASGGYRGENIVWEFENEECSSAIVLPQTGGPGTSIFFTIGGGMLLLGAVLTLLRAISEEPGRNGGTGRFFWRVRTSRFSRLNLCEMKKEENNSS